MKSIKAFIFFMARHIKSFTLNGVACIHCARHIEHTVCRIEHPVHRMEHAVHHTYPIVYVLLGVVPI